MSMRTDDVFAILSKRIDMQGATPAQIQEAVNKYLSENPVDSVTEENIKEALGYTPADQEEVTELNENLVQLESVDVSFFEEYYYDGTKIDEFFEKSMAIGGGGKKTVKEGENPIDPLPWESDGSSNGKMNTFFGKSAGLENTTGNGNTFIGSGAGEKNTNGTQNTFVGWYAGQFNEQGYHNTYIGVGAAQNNKEGYFNTYIGCDCNLSGKKGFNNVAIGTSSASLNEGSENVVVGVNALQDNIVGTKNVAIGSYALANNIKSENTAVGYFSLGGLNTQYSIGNVGIGNLAGTSVKNGVNNTFVGNSAGYAPNTQATEISNSTAIGNGTYTTKSNQVVIGNSAVTEFILGSKKMKFNDDGTVTWEAI